MNVACMSPAHDCSALLRRWYHLLKRVNGVQQLASRYKRSVQKFAKTASGTVEHTPVLAFIECRSTNSASRYVLATLTRRWYIDPERNATGGTFHGLRNEETVERDVIGWCIWQRTDPPRTDVDERTMDGLMPQLQDAFRHAPLEKRVPLVP
jgi:hypothetical protein